MGAVSVVTRERSWFGDAHRRTRTLRVTPHPAERVVTLSLWEGQVCQGTIRLPDAEVPALIGALAEALAGSAAHVVPPPAPRPPARAEVIPFPSGPEAGVAQWVHGPPTLPPVPSAVPRGAVAVGDAVSRALTVVGRGARRVADALAPQGPGPR